MNRKLAFFQRDSAARCDFFCVCVVCVCDAAFHEFPLSCTAILPPWRVWRAEPFQGSLTKTAEGKEKNKNLFSWLTFFTRFLRGVAIVRALLAKVSWQEAPETLPAFSYFI